MKDTPIDQLELSNVASEACARLGVSTVEELKATDAQAFLAAAHGDGRAHREVKEILAYAYGLTPDDPLWGPRPSQTPRGPTLPRGGEYEADVFVDVRAKRDADATALVRDARVLEARTMRVAQWRAGRDELDYRPLVDALAEAPPPRLEVLAIDGFASLDTQLAAPVGSIGPLLARSPSLRRLSVLGAVRDAAGARSDTLESLELLVSPMPEAVIRGLAEGTFPRLRNLALNLGSGSRRASTESVIALLDSLARTSQLDSLHLDGLRAGEAVELLEWLATSELLASLRFLSLFHREPDPTLHPFLLAFAPRRAHLVLALPRIFSTPERARLEADPRVAFTGSWIDFFDALLEGPVVLPGVVGGHART